MKYLKLFSEFILFPFLMFYAGISSAAPGQFTEDDLSKAGAGVNELHVLHQITVRTRGDDVIEDAVFQSGLYNGVINSLRRAHGSHVIAGSGRDTMRMLGSSAELNGTPNELTFIRIVSSRASGPEDVLTLIFRTDNMYLIGFRNHQNLTYLIGGEDTLTAQYPAYRNYLTTAGAVQNLPFGENYDSIENIAAYPNRVRPEMNRQNLLTNIATLSGLGANYPRRDRTRIARAFHQMITIFSEGARFNHTLIQDHVQNDVFHSTTRSWTVPLEIEEMVRTWDHFGEAAVELGQDPAAGYAFNTNQHGVSGFYTNQNSMTAILSLVLDAAPQFPTCN